MSDVLKEDIKSEDIPPMEVKVVSVPEVKKEEDSEDVEYDVLNITSDEIKEFEDGESSSS